MKKRFLITPLIIILILACIGMTISPIYANTDEDEQLMIGDESVVKGDSVNLKYPSNNDTDVFFEWETDLHTDYTQYILQISESQDFETYEEIKQDIALGNKAQLTLSGGIYYARIRAHGEIYFAEDWIVPYTTQWSNVVKFSVPIEDEDIVGGDSVILSAPQQGDPTIVLSWEGNLHTDYTQYIIQISKTDDFEIYEEIRRDFGLGNSVELTLDGNVYYARIRAHGEIYFAEDWIVPYTTPWSNVVQFSIPIEDEDIVKGDYIILQDPQVYNSTALLSWKPNLNTDYTQFIIQISQSPDFETKEEIRCDQALGNNTKLTLDSGIYYARIRAHGEIYFAEDWIVPYTTPWSNVVQFTVPPYNTRFTSGGVNDKYIKLAWNNGVIGSNYEIQYSYDKEFKTNVNSYCFKNDGATAVNIPNDLIRGIRYYFRIRNVASVSGTSMPTVWSPIMSLTYKMDTPYIKTMQVVDNNLIVQWHPVESCTAYNIWYSSDPNFDVWYSYSIGAKSYENSCIIDHLPNGKVYVKIQAVNRINDDVVGYSSWSNPKSVDFKLTKTYLTSQYTVNNAIKVSWKTVNNCDGYEIQYANNPDFENAKTQIVKGKDVGTCNIKEGLMPGTCYFRIRTYKTCMPIDIMADSGIYYSEWSNTKTAVFKLSKTYLTNQYISNNKATVCWKPSTNCDGYQIQCDSHPDFIENAQLIEINDPNSNIYKGIDIAAGNAFFRIRTFIKHEDGTVAYSDWSNTKSLVYSVVEPALKTVSIKSNKLHCNWKTSADFDGYVIEYTLQETLTPMEYVVDNNKINECSITVFPGVYKVRIRGYREVNQIYNYSSWSESHLIEYRVSGSEITAIGTENDQIKLHWDRSSGCHGYQVQYSSDPSMTQDVHTKTIWNTETLDYTFENVKAGTYYVRIRTYKEIDGQRYYSDWSNTKTLIVN